MALAVDFDEAAEGEQQELSKRRRGGSAGALTGAVALLLLSLATDDNNKRHVFLPRQRVLDRPTPGPIFLNCPPEHLSHRFGEGRSCTSNSGCLVLKGVSRLAAANILTALRIVSAVTNVDIVIYIEWLTDDIASTIHGLSWNIRDKVRTATRKIAGDRFSTPKTESPTGSVACPPPRADRGIQAGILIHRLICAAIRANKWWRISPA